MGATEGVSVPESGRKQLEKSAQTFDDYAKQLRARVAWFNRQTLSMSSVEQLTYAVSVIAEELEREASYARSRAELREVGEIRPESLAVDAAKLRHLT